MTINKDHRKFLISHWNVTHQSLECLMKLSSQLQLLQKHDRAIMLAIKRIHHPWLTTFFRIVTHSGRGSSWAIVTISLFFLNKMGINLLFNQQLFFRAFLCPFAAFIIGNIIKVLVKRKRPYEGMKNYLSLVGTPIGDSFPSLHTATSVSLLTGLILLHHPLAGIVSLWALLISFSRIYLGVHYLSDIVGGIILGIGCGFLVYFF